MIIRFGRNKGLTSNRIEFKEDLSVEVTLKPQFESQEEAEVAEMTGDAIVYSSLGGVVLLTVI